VKAGEILDVSQIWLFIPCIFDEILISSSPKGNQIKLRRNGTESLDAENKKQQNKTKPKIETQCKIL